jgi:hypothetical protein
MVVRADEAVQAAAAQNQAALLAVEAATVVMVDEVAMAVAAREAHPLPLLLLAVLWSILVIRPLKPKTPAKVPAVTQARAVGITVSTI